MISYITMTLFTPDLKIMRATVPNVTKLLSVYVVYNSTWRVTLTKQLSLHFHMLKYFITTIAFTLHWVSNVAKRHKSHKFPHFLIKSAIKVHTRAKRNATLLSDVFRRLCEKTHLCQLIRMQIAVR